MDRLDNLEIPQTPCPLVHPPPILVPTPTSKPEKIIQIIGIENTEASTIWG
jgi:hypothetical protein